MDFLATQAARGMTATEWAGMAAAYALGCFTTGYYYVRWRTGKDIRREGSGNVGAKNAGRLLGKSGFAVVSLGDGLKGAVAVGLAHYFDFQDLAVALAMLVVVLGHIWPVQLGFAGGKGLATSVGALILFHWQLALGMLGAALFLYGLSKRVTLSGLGTFAAAPFLALVYRLDAIHIAGVAILSVMVLLAHRSNLMEEMAGKKQPSRLKIEKAN
jgi:glycerol-3-phosphate acyltransferase PlsY